MSRIYVSRAPELDGKVGFKEAWVVGALINGAGVRPELGLWAASGIEPRAGAKLASLNASAKRYSDAPPADGTLPADSPTAAEVESCVGPIPEP